MKRGLIFAGLFVAFTAGLVLMQQQDADADTHKAAASQVAAPGAYAPDIGVTTPEAQPRKKCSFNSDCRYGKCKKHRCGGCSFNSDCKGWGKCKGGWCGGCSFNSDCKGFGSCRSGHCTKSPY